MEGSIKGLVITGGAGPASDRLNRLGRSVDRVVVADSGLERALEAALEPDLVVGDMDSLSDSRLLERVPAERVRTYRRYKDYTDTEIALEVLYEQGCEDILLAGGGGGRLDHLVGIVSLFDRERHPRVWLTASDEVIAIDTELEYPGLRGRTVSFFPVGNEECRMRSEGLRWPLDGLTWRHGDVGISNEVVSDTLRVDMISGRLIMVRALAEEQG
ncbi:MAG: thiamine diphosphokinase [Spirochaetaceae bacterium]